MQTLIPSFDAHLVLVEPWTTALPTYGWMVLMAFLVTATCGLIGNYLILRRMALVGDAISHSVLPGLAIAFLITGGLSLPAMLAGALGAGLLTTSMIEFIHSKSRIKADAAIGITFCTLFALGVVLINVFASRVHLDADCVLYGELSYLHKPADAIAPRPVLIMGGVGLTVAALIAFFYKELLVSSFDTMLAASLGFRPKIIHLCLMAMLSIVIVAAFESVGAILVIAMLILPGATAQLITNRLAPCLWLSVLHAALSAVLGLHLAVWLDCSMAGAVVVAAAFLFTLAWIFAPGGILAGRRGATADPLLDSPLSS
ncbi:metal ABC transporter permease [Phragmitibacter flavus]|uniref:Metal ABC transporter permease n=1 Tax=Phragmitibacter flavus TaxID=2576071 RepID=A0A5R8KFK3_9BACT|nr:metal ABC transporter permease [Phragmitibacter flavus]TLD71080.1 metal ABC transporter permease [Phragmitibacter flavus]